MVICLERGVNALHIMEQLMPLPTHHLLLHFNPKWFSLSGAGLLRLVLEKRPLNGSLGTIKFFLCITSCRQYDKPVVMNSRR